MPRVHHVKAARKDQGTCHNCGAPLSVGGPYRWWKFGGPAGSRGPGGAKVKRCMKPECTPKASDLTQSPFLGALYAAQETLEAAGNQGTPEDVAAMLHGGADELREAAEIRTEAADNIEQGFGHATQQCEDLREEGESVEYWADEVDGIADEVENHEEEDIEGELEDWLTEKVEEANSGCPV